MGPAGPADARRAAPGAAPSRGKVLAFSLGIAPMCVGWFLVAPLPLVIVQPHRVGDRAGVADTTARRSPRYNLAMFALNGVVLDLGLPLARRSRPTRSDSARGWQCSWPLRSELPARRRTRRVRQPLSQPGSATRARCVDPLHGRSGAGHRHDGRARDASPHHRHADGLVAGRAVPVPRAGVPQLHPAAQRTTRASSASTTRPRTSSAPAATRQSIQSLLDQTHGAARRRHRRADLPGHRRPIRRSCSSPVATGCSRRCRPRSAARIADERVAEFAGIDEAGPADRERGLLRLRRERRGAAEPAGHHRAPPGPERHRRARSGCR